MAAIFERLEIDLHAAAVDGGVGAVDADEGREAFNRGIFQDRGCKRLLPLRHRGERDILRRFGNAEDQAGVLHREKSLRHVHEEKNRADQRADGDEQRRRAIAQNELQRLAVERDDGIEAALGNAIEPALIFFALMPQQFRRHHRRERERDERRNDDRHRERDGEFAEEAADDVAHEEQRNQHRDQRNRERKNREADLLGAFQRGLQRRFAFFDEAADVFDHHDGVIDDEAGRNRERHQREVVEAVAEQVHHAERADDRERHGERRDDGGAGAAQEEKDHHDDEGDRQHSENCTSSTDARIVVVRSVRICT